MVQLASIIASQAVNEYRAMLGAALTAGVTPVEAKEIVYQAVPVRRSGEGVRLPARHQRRAHRARRRVAAAWPVDHDSRNARDEGMAVQKRIVGAERVDAMYAAASDDEKHFQRYLSANCFGDYLTRNGLDVRTRELLTFSMLVALGGADPQVKGHVAANLNVGNDRGILLGVLTVLLPFIGYPRTLNGLNAVNDITAAK